MDPENLTDFFIETNKLKSTIRYSSCRREVQESTAGHSWQMSLMVPIIAEEFELNINIEHSMKLAIVHDLGEYGLSQDFDSYLVATGVLSKDEKDRVEKAALDSFRERFSFGQKIYSLWKEFEERKTPEARYVRALDKIESHLHIIQRGGLGDNPRDARHQALYADEAVRNFPELKPLLRVTKKKLRPILEKQGFVWKPEYDYPD